MNARVDYTFCTIITSNYIHYALTLYNSLSKYEQNVSLHIFTTDNVTELKELISEFTNIYIYSVSDLCNEGLGKALYKKYYKTNISAFRWSMKSILMKFLIENKNYEKVAWVDADLFFTGSYEFLFKHLNHYNILLTPHWRPIVPTTENIEFDRLFRDGFYNAGFFSVNKNALHVLEWWGRACLYKCQIDYKVGLHYDQGYLSLMPIYFDNVKALKHQGCNVASWNIDHCKRSIDPHGQVRINEKWEVIFIHMTARTATLIENGTDSLLRPYLKEWKSIMEENRKKLALPIPQPQPKGIKKVFNQLIEKITRLKNLKLIIEE